jgi:hypothetical protein
MRRFAMRKLLLVAGAVMALSGAMASGALGASNPAGTGQPGTAQASGASCGAPGSTSEPNGFSSGGFANAESVYANPGTTSGNQSHAISEYDIACYQQTQNH